MNWADQNGVSYLAWGWFTPDPAPDCNDYYLIDQNGNPVAPNGTLLKAHLAALAASTTGPVGTTSATRAPQYDQHHEDHQHHANQARRPRNRPAASSPS